MGALLPFSQATLTCLCRRAHVRCNADISGEDAAVYGRGAVVYRDGTTVVFLEGSAAGYGGFAAIYGCGAVVWRGEAQSKLIETVADTCDVGGCAPRGHGQLQVVLTAESWAQRQTFFW
eukprot:1425650-Rhodomonas_salina.1